VIARHGPGRFVGELNLLTGQRPFLSARVTEPGRVLALSPALFRRLMATNPDLANIIFNAFVARRAGLRTGQGALAVQVIGSRFSPELVALRSFAERSYLASKWTDLETLEDPDAFLASLGVKPEDAPIVIFPGGLLRRPTPGMFAEAIGLTFHSPPGYRFDLVVVGTGPAGLAASVYGASEGVKTVSLDMVEFGGQAGTSSLIENYVGFPNGISGGDLASRAALQALRLGAQLNYPCTVAGLAIENGFPIVRLADGSEISTRAVMIATGAQYRRLAVDERERFEGAGIYYAATTLEAGICSGQEVIVIGGGNSAGQAAIFLAQNHCHVTIAIRRDDLADSMSRYLIERIDAHPRIEVRACTEVRGLAGESRLTSVWLEHTTTGDTYEVPCAGLFSFIGAIPATEWLGDVRSGSLKRVAAAVGEGSSAVRSVYDYLATVP
jgi:thioredoxin reductase (NADPH)